MSQSLSQTRSKLSLFWLLQIVGWSGYAIDRYLISQRFFPRPFVYILIAFGLTFALRAIYRRVWVRSPAVFTVAVVVVSCSLLAGFVWQSIGQGIFWLLGIDSFRATSWHSFLGETALFTLQNHKAFLFLSWSSLYFGIKYWQTGQQHERQRLQAETLARVAELKMLRYQINPHFLFNSLNSTSALIQEDPDRAERMLNELADFLRYALANTQVSEVALKDELEAIQNYLDVEKVRFEEKLEVRFHMAPATYTFRIPSFLLHPLVENAIKFGMQTSPLPLTVEVTASCSNGTVHLEVANTGKWKEPSARSSGLRHGFGVGLENVRQRLAHAFPGKHAFDVFERDGWVYAVINIEKKGAANGEADEVGNR